jgi:hypothetical protein
MRRRPWPIVIIAFFHFIAPLVNFAVSAKLSQMSLSAYFLQFLAQTPWKISGTLIFAPPAAGLALYMVKEWSYGVYIALMALITYVNFQNWGHSPVVLVASLIVNLSLVSYFMLPTVRFAYFNPRMRWWETQDRYVVNSFADLESATGHYKCKIQDISEGGAFIKIRARLANGEVVRVKVRCLDSILDVYARVVHRGANSPGFGLSFFHTMESEATVARWVKAIDGTTPRLRSASLKETVQDFAKWFFRLVRTGKGWVPELPSQREEGTENTEQKVTQLGRPTLYVAKPDAGPSVETSDDDRKAA